MRSPSRKPARSTGWKDSRACSARAHRQQGEFVLVLARGEERTAESIDAERVLGVLLEALAPSEAAKLAARITGLPKSELYRRALERAK